MDLEVNPQVIIPGDELQEQFIHASGPGGQNVNKVATAVQLRWDVSASTVLEDGAKARLMRLAGSRMTQDGVLVLDARRNRSQERNREDARDRLAELVRQSLVVPRKRRPTRPTAASRRRRMDTKSRRGETKRLRGRVSDTD